MKCAVLGGAGFMGTHLTDALLADGHTVRVFDRPAARYIEYCRQQGSELVTGDFLNPDDVGRAIAGCEIVFHLTSTTVPGTSNENPVYDLETNALGTLRLLDKARQAGVKKIIFASSGGTVYGIPQQIPITEDHPTNPISSYGIGKLTIEKYLQLYRRLYQLDYCILRIANAYGERQPVTDTQGVIAAFLDKAIKKQEIVVWGDGSVIRDFTYIGDVSSAFIRALHYSGEPKLFNISSGVGHCVNDIIEMISKITDQPLLPKYLPGRVFDVPVNFLDISRARQVLLWQPTVSIFEGISRTYEWVLKETH